MKGRRNLAFTDEEKGKKGEKRKKLDVVWRSQI